MQTLYKLFGCNVSENTVYLISFCRIDKLPSFFQEQHLQDFRPYAYRRSFQNLWPISS